MKILLRYLYTVLGGEDIFKPTVENKSPHQDTNNNSKITMFPHRNFHTYT